MADNTSVKVALRVRPLVESEIKRGCNDLLDTYKELQQIRIKDTDKAFTFNYVFGTDVEQNEVYQSCVEPLINNVYKGYNVTILAYGQTGSGKTHSMGTAYNGSGEMGIIPRAVNDIFAYVKDNFAYDFSITVSFMELYQETLYDLLSNKSRDQCAIELREDSRGIIIPGLTEQVVSTATETLDCLMNGSKGRATGSTNMNAQSSRSHAIFTISICMQKKGSSESKTAKFHLVDLAGSERSKKTGATGQTFKEGVNINKGLLALGNVISALGDEKGQVGYIGYRDSNLTRLLKDSLGGNSITLMIACVSPADYNLDETVSTLRYADRARKIKNKPVVNEDPKAAEINNLKKLINQLRLELVGQGGPIICQAELELLKKENFDCKTKISILNLKLSSTLNEKTALLERVMIMQTANEALFKKLLGLESDYDLTLNNLNLSLEQCNETAVKEHVTILKNIKVQFSELSKEHKKNEEEIKNHEISFDRHTINTNATSEIEINERQESHTAHQLVLNVELQEISKRLAQKEFLQQQIRANTCHMVDVIGMAENEAKMTAMQKEKDELVVELKNVQSQSGCTKIAEQRRKRVQELEKQIHDLHKKVQEQARMIKLKEKDELKINALNGEIQKMKQTKVKLIKDMRQESEKFRTWKIQRERELSKLKDQDRKRQNQMVKMETIHSRQQNVLKRKVEEAAAINKRLKDSLALRKQAQDCKMSGKIERFGPLVQRELDVFVNLIEAQTSLSILLEDRGTLQEQLDKLKLQEDASNTAEIEQLENDIELRSSQIQGLQQKILDGDEENKSKTRFDNVSTMSEAKYIIKVLFDLTAENKKQEIVKENRIHDLLATQTDLETKLLLLDERIRDCEQHELSNVMKMQQEHEEKTSILLRQLRGVDVKSVDEEINQRFAIQLQSIEKLENENESLKLKNIDTMNQLQEIRMELERNGNNSEKKPLIPPEIKLNDENMYTPPSTKIGKENLNYTFAKHSLGPDIIPNTPGLDSSIDDYGDDTINDPDWRKTPLAMRMQKYRNVADIESKAVKRTSGGGCNCKSSCGTRICRCKKFGASCSQSCGCSDKLCVNKTDEVPQTIEENEIAFKKPREVHGQPRPKRTKTLFH